MTEAAKTAGPGAARQSPAHAHAGGQGAGREAAAKGRAGRESGFTLVELLVVLVILSLLAALVGPRVVGYMGQSKVKAARIQISGFQTALELFRLDMGRYPTQAEGLGALVKAPAGATSWNGPYLDKGLANDPWGTPYVYAPEGSGAAFRLKSLGADGREGGEGENADIGA